MRSLPEIQLIVFDVDGVLTDGSIYLSDQGVETKRFHVRDGFGIKAAQFLGMQIGILTGRCTPAVTLRMKELEVDLVIQGCKDKGAGLVQLCEKAGVSPDQTAYLGDDLIDLPAMRTCGYPMAVADASEPVRQAARYVTECPGGHGAARQAIEHLMIKMSRWDQIIQRYR